MMVFVRAEDRATQGCDLSAVADAKPETEIQSGSPFLLSPDGEKAINPIERFILSLAIAYFLAGAASNQGCGCDRPSPSG